MSSLRPRVVLVTRKTEYQALLETHGTRGQAEFFLKSRDQQIKAIDEAHQELEDAIQRVRLSVPDDWSIAQVEREDLDRFLFADNDVVIAVGQDGLVANLAKYVADQPILGVTPGQQGSEGVLTSTPVQHVAEMLGLIDANRAYFERLTMVEANLGGGERLVALNELFIGHRSHQSAKYILKADGSEAFHSSSGVIVTTGTGATGWAKSIMTATDQFMKITSTEPKVLFFAREPWPSKTSSCELQCGEIDGSQSIELISRINEGGVIFADGIEQDFLKFNWGRRATISIARQTLNLMTGKSPVS